MLEASGTYNNEHGFGHEDWLFRNDWLIDGWRYAFIQGVNKSYDKLVKTRAAIDLTLFTIQPDKQRRYVATINAVECVEEEDANVALEEFRKRGWRKVMEHEIGAIGGNVSALGSSEWAKHILNVRFRRENVARFPPDTFAHIEDPVMRLNRYQLYDFENIDEANEGASPHRRLGQEVAPLMRPYVRPASPAVEVTPEHGRMQKQLLAELKQEYVGAHI
ncbi:MAG: hypothetical protein JWR16_3545, partial [Nevskia sp.]|nr:hypothetical protein [Nevskia sp.]